MEYGVMFEQIRKMIDEDPDNITILEEVIDVDLQMKYFKQSIEVKKDLDKELVCNRKDELFSTGLSVEDKKLLLTELASVNDVSAFRAIEKYMNAPDIELKDWSVLAFQESRMLIQSSLMEKSPLFISTGLGGKKDKLRYCVVLFNKDQLPFSGVQQSVITGELDFMIKQENYEVESVDFIDHYCRIIVMIPLRVSVKDSLLALVNNCNELGDFIEHSFLVTNVKRLNSQEILDAINKKEEDVSDAPRLDDGDEDDE